MPHAVSRVWLWRSVALQDNVTTKSQRLSPTQKSYTRAPTHTFPHIIERHTLIKHWQQVRMDCQRAPAFQGLHAALKLLKRHQLFRACRYANATTPQVSTHTLTEHQLRQTDFSRDLAGPLFKNRPFALECKPYDTVNSQAIQTRRRWLRLTSTNASNKSRGLVPVYLKQTVINGKGPHTRLLHHLHRVQESRQKFAGPLGRDVHVAICGAKCVDIFK